VRPAKADVFSGRKSHQDKKLKPCSKVARMEEMKFVKLVFERIKSQLFHNVILLDYTLSQSAEICVVYEDGVSLYNGLQQYYSQGDF